MASSEKKEKRGKEYVPRKLDLTLGGPLHCVAQVRRVPNGAGSLREDCIMAQVHASFLGSFVASAVVTVAFNVATVLLNDPFRMKLKGGADPPYICWCEQDLPLLLHVPLQGHKGHCCCHTQPDRTGPLP